MTYLEKIQLLSLHELQLFRKELTHFTKRWRTIYGQYEKESAENKHAWQVLQTHTRMYEAIQAEIVRRISETFLVPIPDIDPEEWFSTLSEDEEGELRIKTKMLGNARIRANKKE